MTQEHTIAPAQYLKLFQNLTQTSRLLRRKSYAGEKIFVGYLLLGQFCFTQSHWKERELTDLCVFHITHDQSRPLIPKHTPQLLQGVLQLQLPGGTAVTVTWSYCRGGTAVTVTWRYCRYCFRIHSWFELDSATAALQCEAGCTPDEPRHGAPRCTT